MTYPEISGTTNALSSKWSGVSQMRMPAIRRGGRGGTAWSLPHADQMTRQPQDGSASAANQVLKMRPNLHSNVLHESEDARLTGGTRTLNRRLLGLNVGAVRRKGVAAASGSSRAQFA
jgi:hypothetical protein